MTLPISPSPSKNSFENAAGYVINSTDRILAQIDSDPLSPTFGCSHLAYWRDKTSEFADMRRQEVMFALALLYTYSFKENKYFQNPDILFYIESLITFWARNQYADGSQDEWYKGERACAAVAFGTHALARTLQLVDHMITPDLRTLATKSLMLSASWLSRRNDLFKTNHQAVAASALVHAGKYLKRSDFIDNARGKLDSITVCQTPEGWFPELGYMDIGYTFLTVEFALSAMFAMKEYHWLPTFERAFDLATNFMHPDLTIGSEYSSCGNTYISYPAIADLRRRNARAVYLFNKLTSNNKGYPGQTSTLHDDLRLLRWAYQPLVALYSIMYSLPIAESYPVSPDPPPLFGLVDADILFPDAGLVILSVDKATAIFAPCAGGLLRFFNTDGTYINDHGYAFQVKRRHFSTVTYNPTVRKSFNKERREYQVIAPIIKVRRILPGFLPRLLLRLAASTALSSRLTRGAIDIFRKKKGTSINQSSTNIRSYSKHNLFRTVRVKENTITVYDRIEWNPIVSKSAPFLIRSIGQGPIFLLPESRPFGRSVMEFKRTYIFKNQKWFEISQGDFSLYNINERTSLCAE